MAKLPASSRIAALTLSSLFLGVGFVHAQNVTGSWTPLDNQPNFYVGICLLLTDASVICQAQTSQLWYKLTPTIFGGYVSGTWSQIASFPAGYAPDAAATAVLADGRAVVVGGEYNNGAFVLTNHGAIYDPKTNLWTSVPAPPGIQYVGDAPSLVLTDGTFLIGSKLDQRMAILNPTTLTWNVFNPAGKIDGFNSEEGWVLLPDGSVFTLDVKNAPFSERFIPSTSTWVSAGLTATKDLHTPTDESSITLGDGSGNVYHPPGEIGPDVLLPDGTVFVVGATGQTAIFTPPAANSTAPGTWKLGPAMPTGLCVKDGPAVVLPSGNVLLVGSPSSDTILGGEANGLQFFEFDGTKLNTVNSFPAASSGVTFATTLLLLPTGQVMAVGGAHPSGLPDVEIYTPSTSKLPNPSWVPVITSVAGVNTTSQTPPTLTLGETYRITGTQFNGLTQANGFGDEFQSATNYPLVFIRNISQGYVSFAPTHGHSTMGVATGSTPVSTNFDVPWSTRTGPSTITVVANGILSEEKPVTVVSPLVDLAEGILNLQFTGTPGTCPTSWICGGDPPPGFASYAPTSAQYPGGPQFLVSASSPTVLAGSGNIRQITSLKWINGDTYFLNLWAGLPKTEPNGTTPVEGWAQTARLYLTFGDGFGQVAAFDIPRPAPGTFASNQIKFKLPADSSFGGQKIGVLLFVSAGSNFTANFDITLSDITTP